MTRTEFADKYLFPYKDGDIPTTAEWTKMFNKDLDVLIADEVKNLALPHVIKSVGDEHKSADWRREHL